MPKNVEFNNPIDRIWKSPLLSTADLPKRGHSVLSGPLSSTRFVWVSPDDSSNEWGVGYFRQYGKPMASEREKKDVAVDKTVEFEKKCLDDVFESDKDGKTLKVLYDMNMETAIPKGGLVRYVSLQPVLLYDFAQSWSSRKEHCTIVPFPTMRQSITSSGIVHYSSGCQDPRLLLSSVTGHGSSGLAADEAMKFLWRGCQKITNGGLFSPPNTDALDKYKVSVFIERFAASGGFLTSARREFVSLKQPLMNESGEHQEGTDHLVKRNWTVTTKSKLVAERSQNFPYPQFSAKLVYRRVHHGSGLEMKKLLRKLNGTSD